MEPTPDSGRIFETDHLENLSAYRFNNMRFNPLCRLLSAVTVLLTLRRIAP